MLSVALGHVKVRFRVEFKILLVSSLLSTKIVDGGIRDDNAFLIGYLRGLHIKPALFRIQLSVGLFHDRTARKGVHTKKCGSAV